MDEHFKQIYINKIWDFLHTDEGLMMNYQPASFLTLNAASLKWRPEKSQRW